MPRHRLKSLGPRPEQPAVPAPPPKAASSAIPPGWTPPREDPAIVEPERAAVAGRCLVDIARSRAKRGEHLVVEFFGRVEIARAEHDVAEHGFASPLVRWVAD